MTWHNTPQSGKRVERLPQLQVSLIQSLLDRTSRSLLMEGLDTTIRSRPCMRKARDLWGPTDSQLRRRIACLISIGTGVPKSKTLEPGLRQTLKTLSKMVSDTQTTANRFRRDKSELVSNQQYFRFNVDVGLQGIGLEEHQKQAVIADATSTYLDRPDIKDQLVLCAKNLHNQRVGIVSQPTEASQPMDSTAHTDRVTSLDVTHRVQFSLAGVPFADKFVDRPEEMKAMSSRLLPSHDDNEDSGKKIYVLQGMGGIGKTQLAAAFFTRFGKQFSAAFWLKANTERDLCQSLARCARRIPGRGASESFHKTCADSPEEEKLLAEELLDWLARDDNRNWLLVFDNVDLDPDLDKDHQAGAYDILEYLQANHGAILVTTRLQRMTQLGGNEGSDEGIGSVSPALGRQIFLKWFGLSALQPPRSTSFEKIENLVGPDVLGGLPLAIAQAAVYIRKTKVSVGEYRRRYKGMWLHVMDAAGGRSLVHGYHKSVGTTWWLSLQQVEEREPLAGSLVRMWAFLDHRDFWYGMLRKMEDGSKLFETFSEGISRDEWTEKFGPMEVPDWLRVLSRDEGKYLGCMEALLDFGLIERIRGFEADLVITSEGGVDPGDGQGFTMHPVVHMWAMQIQDDTEKYLSLHNAVLLFRVGKFREGSFSERRRPHTTRCSEWLMMLDPRGGHFARNVMCDGLSVHAVQKVAWCLRDLDMGLLDRAISLVELLQEHIVCDADDLPHNLLRYQRQASNDSEQSRVCVPWKILWSAMDAHAMMLRDAGDFTASETKFKQALELSAGIGGESHVCAIETLNYLGMVLSDQLNYREGENFLLKASGILDVVPVGMRSPELKREAARNALILGDLYSDDWQLDKARHYLTEAIAAGQEIPEVKTNAQWKFAHKCLWSRRPQEAEPLLLDVLEADLKSWGLHHNNTRTTKLYLAYTYAAQHKEQETIAMMDQVFKDASQVRIIKALRSITNRAWWLNKRGLGDLDMEIVLKRGWDEAFRIAHSCDRRTLSNNEANVLSSTFRALRHLYAREERPEFSKFLDQMYLLDPWYLQEGKPDKSDAAGSVGKDGRLSSEETAEVGSVDDAKGETPLQGLSSMDNEAGRSSIR